MTTVWEELHTLSQQARALLIEDYDRGDRISCHPDNLKFLLTKPLAPLAPKVVQPIKKAPAPVIRKPVMRKAAPRQEPPKTEEKPKPVEKPSFTLEKPSEETRDDFADLRKELRELFPSFRLVDAIPDDAEAKAVLQQWQRKKQRWQVLVLGLTETAQEQTFLSNVARAIHRARLPAGYLSAEELESEDTWKRILESESLQFLFCSLEQLKKHNITHSIPLQEDPLSLGKLQVFDLGEIGKYLGSAEEKAALWQRIKERLSS